MPQGKFVESIIGDEYMEWVEGDKIVISTPTGSGKTTFVISKLLKYAVAQEKHIIYYCNRKVLNEQFLVRSKEDIKRFFESDVEINDAAAQYLHIYNPPFCERHRRGYETCGLSHISKFVTISTESSVYYRTRGGEWWGCIAATPHFYMVSVVR